MLSTWFCACSFDPVSILRAELARKNMYLRDDYGAKRQRVSGTDGGELSQFSPGKGNRENPPCNTLFIGNLSEGVSKQELEGLFGHQQVGPQSARAHLPFPLTCTTMLLSINCTSSEE